MDKLIQGFLQFHLFLELDKKKILDLNKTNCLYLNQILMQKLIDETG